MTVCTIPFPLTANPTKGNSFSFPPLVSRCRCHCSHTASMTVAAATATTAVTAAATFSHRGSQSAPRDTLPGR